MFTWICLLLVLTLVILSTIQIRKLGIIKKIFASFDNSADGFSARKLSAFTGVAVCVIATFRFVDGTTVIEALMVWLGFGLLCMGIITAEQLLKIYNKGGKDDSSKSIEKKDESQSEPPVEKL